MFVCNENISCDENVITKEVYSKHTLLEQQIVSKFQSCVTSAHTSMFSPYLRFTYYLTHTYENKTWYVNTTFMRRKEHISLKSNWHFLTQINR